MEEQIAQFGEQFSWEPEIGQTERLPKRVSRLLVCGMGGSHLGAELLRAGHTELMVDVWSDYGLPDRAIDSNTLIVASSYSGQTEEILDAAQTAIDRGIPLAVVTTGGTLAALAHEHKLPLIVLPREHVEPRMAVGVSMLALARLLGNTELESKIRRSGQALDTRVLSTVGETLAAEVGERTPLIYASNKNSGVAYFWKIACNETGKIPAFSNVVPELCHNELSGFDSSGTARMLATSLHAIFLPSETDHPRVQKRMTILRDILTEHGVGVSVAPAINNTFDQIFTSIITGVWMADALAHRWGVTDDAGTPIIDELKRKMKEV